MSAEGGGNCNHGIFPLFATKETLLVQRACNIRLFTDVINSVPGLLFVGTARSLDVKRNPILLGRLEPFPQIYD